MRQDGWEEVIYEEPKDEEVNPITPGEGIPVDVDATLHMYPPHLL